MISVKVGIKTVSIGDQFRCRPSTTYMVCQPVIITLDWSTNGDFMYYYQHHIGDYRRDTGHLTLLEHGIYRQLLDLYYITEKPLDANAMRLVCVRSPEEQEAYQRILQDFFFKQNGKWLHKRCEEEIKSFHGKSDKAKDSANKRWNKNKELSDANALPTDSEGNANGMLTINHKPLTINHKPLTKLTTTPEGVSQATTRTVVISSLSVLALDFLLTAMMFSN